jgi:tetraacyldisaccharide 4'-kinase
LVLCDARDPFAGRRLLPWGGLREPATGLRRASAVLLTRCGRAAGEQILAAERQVETVHPGLPVLRENHQPLSLVDAGGGPALESLRGARVLAFSSIKDPTALAESLRALGALLVRVLDYGDHHEYRPDELAELEREAEAAGAALAVTTEKDLMRVPAWRGRVPLRALRIASVRTRTPSRRRGSPSRAA